jgi:AraC-like DNA-binding protein
MKRTLYENLSNADFDLAKAISKTGYSDDHFRRRFFEETGKTPLQYLTDLRITHAKQLLLSKESFSVSTVALGCGFADSFYFSTCFKKHVGCSPRAYQSRALAQPATPSSQSHVQAHHNQKADDEK